jgi:chromate transport protein ChrA
MSATEMPPHVAIVFKELFEELWSTKRQQWTTTNYCVLILAAIYAAQLPYASPLAVITAIVGSGLLLKMQSHLARSRIRLDKVHKTYFDEEELRAIGLTDKEIKALRDEKRLASSNESALMFAISDSLTPKSIARNFLSNRIGVHGLMYARLN